MRQRGSSAFTHQHNTPPREQDTEEAGTERSGFLGEKLPSLVRPFERRSVEPNAPRPREATQVIDH